MNVNNCPVSACTFHQSTSEAEDSLPVQPTLNGSEFALNDELFGSVSVQEFVTEGVTVAGSLGAPWPTSLTALTM